ncbi:MAG: hypothetical protein LKK19_04790, partial [Bacteroidales bacterium]|nr:hypothetical protein [Bacteroidales bacterium]
MMIKILEHTANRIAVIALAALLSAACINDTPDSEVVSQTQIGFTADVTSASWNALTKSSMISTDADSVNIEEEVTAFDGEEVATKGARVDAISQYGSFGTFAYVYPNSKNWASAKSALTPDFMYNIESENIGGQWRPSDKEYYWPAASYAISFFAYSPYMDYKTNGTPVSDFMKISGSTTTGAPVIDYTVPEELANQIDLMTADSTDISCSYHQAVPMNFHHVLSGVRFNAKTYGAEITIRKVEISNVYDHGTLAMDGNAWNLSGTKDDFTFSTSHTVSGSSVEINDASDSLFFMLPQTLPSGAKLTVTYVMNGSENTATADFSGKVWEMGKVYAYNLTLDANVIYYTLTVIPVSMPGDDCNDAVYKVVSTRTKDNGNGSPVVEDVPYTISGLPDGASYKVNGDGTFTVTAAAREGKDSVLTCGSAYAMRNIQALNYNGSTPIDLTTGEEYTNSAEGETANCYVINCAGYYCFPANVMGNGDDGVIKNNSYGISENGYFVDYQYKNGKTYLSNAQLNTTGCKAVLLWEDVKGLIDESTIELTSNHYIRFKTVPRDEITPGNAVIALEGADGTIRWSWHIWCTLPSKDYTYNDPNTGRDTTIFVKGISMHGDGGTTFNTARYKETSYGWFGTKVTSSSYQTKIMDVNLGSVERSRRFVCYSSRNFDFRVTQNISGNSADGTYSQAEKDIDIVPAGTTNTLYQWGRKDPFVSGNISTVASDN